MTSRRNPPTTLEFLQVDRSSPVPVYLQIAAGFRRILESGAMPAGHPLPPERTLCDAIGVSRMTLRQAMGLLDQEGLITSHQGRGTFVAPMRLRKQQQELRSFTEDIQARGGRPESRMVSFAAREADQGEREFFGLPDKALVYEVCRLRLNSGVPLAIESVILPARLCPNLDRFDLAGASLYRLLEENYGVAPGSCTEEISARLATPAQRKLLEIPKDGAVLVIHRRTYTQEGQALEVTATTYRADLYSAIVHSVRPRR